MVARVVSKENESEIANELLEMSDLDKEEAETIKEFKRSLCHHN